ncbi:hypothetical protein, partial [Escherichia marmotae]
IRRDKRRIRHLYHATGGCGVNALSALHMQSCRPDKTRQASHPALVPRHWRMRREALSALHVQSCRPDKTRQASHPAFIAPLRTG